MSTEPPVGAYLARTLDPEEREIVESLRRSAMRKLAVTVPVLLIWVLMVVLTMGRSAVQSWNFKMVAVIGVVGIAAALWVARRRAGRYDSDLEQGAVYRIEGTLEGKRRSRQKGGSYIHELKVAGQRYDASENQFEAVVEGAPCTIEFLPASRVALSVNGTKRLV